MNRHERRRARSMHEFVASGDADKTGTPAFEPEVERDSKLALELEQHIRKATLQWLATHPNVDWTCTAPALLRMATLEIIAGAPGTTPEDVGVMAAEVAKTVEPVAVKIGDQARELMRETSTPPTESIVQKQIRLVLEKQTREIADKLSTMVPAGVGFLLFLADYGVRGNVSYVSSCNRDDAIQLVTKWLARTVQR